LAEIKWIKLSLGMFDDEKIKLIESMPEADTILIIWVKLLTLAGKKNAKGYIFLSETIPYSDEMLATVFGRPITTVRLALKVLRDFQMIEIDDDHFIAITNWEKHQSLDKYEHKKEQDRLRKQKQRERQKLESQKLLQDGHVTLRDGHAIEEEEEEDKDIGVVSSSQNAFAFYQENFGVLSPYMAEQIEHWIRDMGDVLVIESMKRALEQGKKWAYADGILKAWFAENIQTVEDVIARENEFKRQKQRKGVIGNGGGTKKSNTDTLKELAAKRGIALKDGDEDEG